jgi:MFS family permease
MVGGVAITVFGVKEPAAAPIDAAGRHGLREYVAALLRHRQALRFLACVFAFNVGFAAVLPYLTLFIVDDIHQTEETALILAAGTLLVTGVAAVIFGKLGERVSAKTVLVVGWGLLAVAAVGGLLIQDLPQTIAVVVIAGIGNGAQTAVAWPFLSLLIPPDETGVFAGRKASAESISIPLSVFIAAELFLPRFGYRGIFALLALFIVIAIALLLATVRTPPLHPRRGDAADT